MLFASFNLSKNAEGYESLQINHTIPERELSCYESVMISGLYNQVPGKMGKIIMFKSG